MAYALTTPVVGGTTTAFAVQYNSLMSEMKAAAEGISTHNVDKVIAYNVNNLISTITITDGSSSSGFDITLVGTYSYNVNSLVSQIAWVFDAGEMNITQTEVFTYNASNLLTGIARTLS